MGTGGLHKDPQVVCASPAVVRHVLYLWRDDQRCTVPALRHTQAVQQESLLQHKLLPHVFAHVT